MSDSGFEAFPRGAPLRLEISFLMPRPKYHYNSRGQLKTTAPARHTVKPDTTKMLRAAEDALTSILWHDDGQVAEQRIAKLYADQPGAIIEVSLLS